MQKICEKVPGVDSFKLVCQQLHKIHREKLKRKPNRK